MPKRIYSERELIQEKYRKYKKRDEQNGYLFDWEKEEFHEFIKKSKCIYCGRKEWVGLDRINNKKGHSKDNTVPACEICNLTRSNRFTHEEMKVIGKAIKKLNIKNRRLLKG